MEISIDKISNENKWLKNFRNLQSSRSNQPSIIREGMRKNFLDILTSICRTSYIGPVRKWKESGRLVCNTWLIFDSSEIPRM